MWEHDGDVSSGGLKVVADGFELNGRDRLVSIGFAAVLRAAIARGRRERLRGLPVLDLQLRDGNSLRVASLEGVGALHELAARVEASGLHVAI